MKEVLRKNVTIPPDGQVQLDLSMLPTGQSLQLVLYVTDEQEPGYQSWDEVIGSAKGSFTEAAEIDAYMDTL